MRNAKRIIWGIILLAVGVLLGLRVFGVDIIAPKGVNVKVESTSIFGGTDDTCDKDPASPITIYIDTVSIFGGVDIK